MSIDFYPNSNYFVTSSIVTDFDSGIRLWKLKKKSAMFQFNPGSAANLQQAEDSKSNAQNGATFEKYEIVHQYDLQ